MSGPARPRRPLIEALEPRMLFSATADIAIFDDGSSDPDYLAQAAQSIDLTRIYSYSGVEDAAPDAVTATDSSVKPLDILVVVDTSVKNYEALVNDILQARGNQALEIIYIEPGADGIASITRAMANYSGIDSLHLISHGDTTSLQLGTTKLSLDNLAGRESEFVQWRNALADDADILLYGCNIAATETGRNLLDKLSTLTQADIAASNDVTGHKSRGGDWDLEYASGEIEAGVILSQQVQEAWQHTLTVYETSGAAPDTLFVKSDAQAHQSFVHTSGTGTYTVNEISLQMMRNQFADQTAQTITVSLLSGGYNGTVLASTAISSTSLGTTMSWVDFSVGSQSLNDGQTYYIKVTTNSTVQLVQLGIHNTDAYAGGNFITHFGVADTSRDLGFEVSSNNSPPTVANAIPNQNATEDSAFNFQFASNTFNDVNGNTLTYSAQLAGGGALPSWLNFNAATRTFSGTPLNANVGTVSIDVIANDGNGGTVTDTFNITVANTNDAPTVANAIPNQNATEDSAFNFQFASNTFNDVDVGNTLTYSAQLAGGGALPSWLSFNAATRTFSGTPLNANVGTVSIDVIANDGNGGTVTDTFNITVANTNDAPTVANAIPNQNATEDSAFNFQFASNTFNDVDVGNTLTYSAQLAGGGALPSWLSFNAATRTFSGTPLNANVGTVSIDVIANDGNGGTVTDTFNITVANTNDAPTVANAIPNQNATEDSAFNFQFASNTFSDIDVGNTLTYSAQLSGGGALPSWLNFNAATRTFSGTPANDDVSTVAIDVIASDGNGGTVSDTFTITVANSNDAPTVANAIPNQNATEDSAFNFQFASNTFNDVDVGNTLTYSAQLAGGGALPSWLSFNAATRTFSGTPANVDVGTVSIDVIASDGNGGTVTDTFDITVANTNDAPTVANPIVNQTATENSLFNFTFAVNTFDDQDVGDTLTYTAQLVGGSALPAWLNFDANTRTFSGTPSNGDIGTISVEVIADDGNLTVSETFDLIVQLASGTDTDPVIANPIPNQTATEDVAFNFQFAANTFSDADVGDTLTYTATMADGSALPAWLSFNAATRTFSGTPANDDVGTISIRVTADDGNGGTPANDTFDISIANTNDAPVVSNPIADQNATESAAFNFTFAANTFTDVDTGNSLTYSAQLSGGSPLPGWLSFNSATRTFSGVPDDADVGTLTIEVIADDGNGGIVTDTFQLNVANVNDDPFLNIPIPDQNATEDSPFNYSFPGNTFGDGDIGASFSYTAQLSGGGALPSWLSFDSSTRTFSGTPVNVDVGTISIEVTVDDGNGGTASDTFDIVIANTNDAPTVANPISNQNATEATAFNFQFASNTFNDVDVSDTLTYTATLSGGGALPSWLAFDAVTRTFSGVPTTADIGAITIDVTADDGNGSTVTDSFSLTVAALGDTNYIDTGDGGHFYPVSSGNQLGQSFSFDSAGSTYTVNEISLYLARYGSALPQTITVELRDTWNGAVIATDSIASSQISATGFEWHSFDFSDVVLNDNQSYVIQISTDANDDSILVSRFDSDTFVDGALIQNGVTDAAGWDLAFKVSKDDGLNSAPTLDNPIANQTINAESPFNLVVPANTFSDPDANDTLTYRAQLVGGGSLDWLTFNEITRTFSGTPHWHQAGTMQVELIATDNHGASTSAIFDIDVINTNNPPTVANPIPDQNATEDAAFNFQFASNTFDDLDANTFTYTAQLAGGGGLPPWLSFDAATRTFSGTPANGDVGIWNIDVIANDGFGGTVTDTFSIVVDNTNDAPVLDNFIPNQNATQGSAFNFQFALNTFSDVDTGDTLVYSVQLAGGGALPTWLTFDAATRTFGGTPANSDVGTVSIEVIANDGNGGTISDTFDIVVANINDAPGVANPIADQNATEDAAFNFQFAANTFADADLDTLTYSAQLAGGGALPAWLSFDAATRTFSGTPANADVGTLSIDVIADDGNGGTVTDTFNIVVANTNDAPTVANAIPNQNAAEDTPFNFVLPANTFYDLDAGDVLTYSAQLAGGGALPAWLSFDAATGTFSGTPTEMDVGTVVVEVIATDTSGESVYDAFNIVIAAVNDAPATTGLNAINNLEDAAGDQVNLWPAFSDQEESANNLTYTVISNTNPALVAGATIDQATGQLQLVYGANQFGTAQLVIRAQDSQGAIVEAPLVINIAAVNDNPLGGVIADIEVNAGQVPMQLDLHNFFNDVEDGTNLAYSIQSNSNSQIVPQIQINQITGQMTLAFSSSVGGETTIVLRAQDADGAWVDLNFTVSVIPVASQPGGGTGTEPPDTTIPPINQTPGTNLPGSNFPGTDFPVDELPEEEDEQDENVLIPPSQTGDPALNNAEKSSGVLVGNSDGSDGFAQSDDKSSRDYQRYEQLQDNSNTSLSLLNTETSSSLIRPDAGFMPWELADFDDEIRRMREQMDEAVAEEEKRKAVVAGITFSVTTGLLVWSLRASSLLLTLFSMLPLWRGMDPLPILEEVNKRKKELEQQRQDRQREDKSAKEVGYLFDNTQGNNQGNSRS